MIRAGFTAGGASSFSWQGSQDGIFVRRFPQIICRTIWIMVFMIRILCGFRREFEPIQQSLNQPLLPYS